MNEPFRNSLVKSLMFAYGLKTVEKAFENSDSDNDNEHNDRQEENMQVPTLELEQNEDTEQPNSTIYDVPYEYIGTPWSETAIEWIESDDTIRERVRRKGAEVVRLDASHGYDQEGYAYFLLQYDDGTHRPIRVEEV